MTEETKQIILDSVIKEAKKLGLRGAFCYLTLISLWTVVIFPDWRAPYVLAVAFALLAIAYQPVKA